MDRRNSGLLHVHLAIAVLLCSGLWNRGVSWAANEAKTIPLSGKSVSFAVAPDAGTVAVVSSDGTLTCYPKLLSDKTLDGALVEKSGATYASVAHKVVAGAPAGYFVALARNDKTLRVFDDRTFATVKTVALNGGVPGTVVASLSASDPYVVYSVAGSGGFGADTNPHCVNLKTFADEGPIEIGRERINQVALSADGSKLYGRQIGQSPTLVRCWRIEPATNGFRGLLLHAEHETRPPYVPDALGQHVACGKTLYTADMRQVMMELPATPACFLPDRPLCICLDGDVLTALSYNSFKQAGSFTLPGAEGAEPDAPATGARGSRAARGRGRTAPRRLSADQPLSVVQYDPKRHELLVCREAQIVIVPLAAIATVDEPFLYVAANSADLSVDQPAQIRLTKLDPRAKLELVTGPTGLTLQGDALKWTPASGDVGDAKARIKISAGGVERLQEIDLTVRRASVALPFTPEEVHLSSDGKSLLLLRYSEETARDGRPNIGANRPAYCRLALVQIGAANPDGTVSLPKILDRTLTAAVTPRSADLDDRYVYLPLQDADAFQVLSAKDLSDVRQIFTPGRVGRITPVGQTLYVGANTGIAPGGRAAEGALRFKLPAIEPEPADPATMVTPNPFENHNGQVIPFHTSDGWLFEGTLYGSSIDKPRLLVEGRGFVLSTTLRVYLGPDPANQYNPTVIAPWGVYLRGLALQHIGGQQVAQLSIPNSGGFPGEFATSTAILPDIPAAAVLDVSTTQARATNNNGATQHAQVRFFDLRAGAPAATAVLSDEPESRPLYNPTAPHNFLEATRGLIVAVVGQRMFLLPTTGSHAVLDAAKLPVPLHFVYQQSAFAVDGDKSTVLKHTAQGGVAPIEYSLSAPTNGILINSTTGAVTVDAKALAAKLSEEAFQQVRIQYRQLTPTTQPGAPNFAESASSYVKRIGPRFATFAGHPPRGIPIAIEFAVVARDHNQQTATLPETLLVDLPMQMVLAKASADEAQERARMQAATQPMRRPFPTTQPSSGSIDVASLQRRVQQLEQENAQLRAKVEVLTDLVRSSQRAPTTQPR